MDSEAAPFSIATDFYLASLGHLCSLLPQASTEPSKLHNADKGQTTFVYTTPTTESTNLLLILIVQKSELYAA